jgi:CubicO group peptidase (beta-lactamase class C family)
MISSYRCWSRQLACAVFLAAALASHSLAASVSNAAAAQSIAPVLKQQAVQFWQAVLAEPEARRAIVERHFSATLRARIGDAELMQMLGSLAEVVGSEIAAVEPTPTESKHVLHYQLPSGQGIALMLELSDSTPVQIERFGVHPLAAQVAAVDPAQLSAEIGARLQSEFDAGRFSGAVLLARGKQVIHAQAIGFADRSASRRNTLDTPINLGSINKMFTGIAIAQLQAEGELDWHDTVGKHLPDFPNAKIRDHVTIHQLLTHTSGIASYWNDKHDQRRAALDSQSAFLDLFVSDPLQFEPGKGLEYSNGGPVVLGLIIEAISGLDYYDYIRKRIYQAAGMQHADHYHRNDKAAKFALGYLRAKDGSWQDNTAQLSLRGSAAGGGYASARDLLAFANALGEERLLPRQQLETLWTPRGDTGPIGYGYLFGVGSPSGRRWVGHNGGAPGVSADFRYYPGEDMVIIVLANQDKAAMAFGNWLHALVEASITTHGE